MSELMDFFRGTRAIVIAVQCNYCTKYFPPAEIRTMGESIKICPSCAELQTIAIEGFIPPDFCQVCFRPTYEIAAEEPGETFSMFPHWKDGIYQLLCRKCDAAYVPKRRDLIKGTRFAEERKLL